MQPLRDSTNGVEITANMVAGTTLGERCWVKWPYLQVHLLLFVIVEKSSTCQCSQSVQLVMCPAAAGPNGAERVRLRRLIDLQGGPCGCTHWTG